MKLNWYRFRDGYSGGGTKTEYDAYHIQAPDRDTAVTLFEAYTRLDAYNVTCDCCGPDWDIYEIDEEDARTAWGREALLVIDWATITDAIDVGGE